MNLLCVRLCVFMCVFVCVLNRYKDGKLITRRPEFNRMRQHQNLEIRDVCQEDSGNYTVVLRSKALSLEKRLTYTLIINGSLL